jgi:hypothetical protein
MDMVSWRFGLGNKYGTCAIVKVSFDRRSNTSAEVEGTESVGGRVEKGDDFGPSGIFIRVGSDGWVEEDTLTVVEDWVVGIEVTVVRARRGGVDVARGDAGLAEADDASFFVSFVNLEPGSPGTIASGFGANCELSSSAKTKFGWKRPML